MATATLRVRLLRWAPLAVFAALVLLGSLEAVGVLGPDPGNPCDPHCA